MNKKFLISYLIAIILLTLVIFTKDRNFYKTNSKLTLENKVKIENIESLYRIDHKTQNKYTLEYDFFVNKNKKLTLRLYGKKIDDNKYGINKVIVFDNEKIVQVIFMQDFIKSYSDEEFTEEYTEAYMIDGGLILDDINFDGYLDMGLSAYYGNDSDAYYYFAWDNTEYKFKYVDCLNKLSIDKGSKQLIEYQHIGFEEYILYYYNIKGNNIELVKEENYNLAQNENEPIKTLRYKKEDKYFIINIEYKNLKQKFNLNLHCTKYNKRNDSIYEDDYFEDYFFIDKMEVLKNDNLIQTILFEEEFQNIKSTDLKEDKKYIENKPVFKYISSPIGIEDINFDGYLDFNVSNQIYERYSPIWPECYYIWDNEKNKFEYAFSNKITFVDNENKILTSGIVVSPCVSINYYKIENKKDLKLIKKEYKEFMYRPVHTDYFIEQIYQETITEYLEKGEIIEYDKITSEKGYGKEVHYEEVEILACIKKYFEYRDNVLTIHKLEILDDDKIIQTIFLDELAKTKFNKKYMVKENTYIGFEDIENIKNNKNFNIFDDKSNIKIEFVWNKNKKQYEIR